MTSLFQAFVVAGALFAVACERSPSAPAAKPDTHRATRATQEGEASFYAKDLSGQKTATGERLKLDDMTAASPTLPLGTQAQVTNKETGQSAKVRINDRGPYVGGRVIDLTPRAAKRIGIQPDEGAAPVSVQPITPDHDLADAQGNGGG